MAVEQGFHLNQQWMYARTFPNGHTFEDYMKEDLSVTSRPALDPLIFGKTVLKGLFEGRVVLQVVEVVDVAADPNKEVENTRRCLKCRLSDGYTDIWIIEQGLLSDITCLVTGCKVQLLGPLLVRGGIALVHACNVMVMSSA